MDPNQHRCAESWANSSFSLNNSKQQCQDKSIYILTTDSSLQQFLNQQNDFPSDPSDQIQTNQTLQTSQIHDWDPNSILNNLSFLEQKIHHLENVVHLITGHNSHQQQQLVTTELTSVIVQLISTAGSLLKLNQMDVSDSGTENQDKEIEKGESFQKGSYPYEILQLEIEEILAPHSHHCSICYRGFKRDANLRMHMRGHGDEYKTAAALAKPKQSVLDGPAPLKRYSCPILGCKRNKEHKKFRPLKTVMCVKNHYKRTHCEKKYVCSICNTKRFSILADLKTHEKHCGREKCLCSCGTTFSRKDKLLGHIAIFQGHTPAGNGDVNMMEENCEDLGGCFKPLNFETIDFGEFSEFT